MTLEPRQSGGDDLARIRMLMARHGVPQGTDAEQLVRRIGDLRDEVERLHHVARLADTFKWPCRRHQEEGCDDCTACLMVRALHAVGLGNGLEPGTERDEEDGRYAE